MLRLLVVSFLPSRPIRWRFFIEGYAGQPGVAQTRNPHSSAPRRQKFEIEVTRLGAKREVMWKKADVPGAAHPVPEDASANGCRWPESVRVPSVRIGRAATTRSRACARMPASGKWTHRGARTSSSAWFIVRQAKPAAPSKILLQLCSRPPQRLQQLGRLLRLVMPTTASRRTRASA